MASGLDFLRTVPAFVYGLTAPDGEIRYVGCSADPGRRRRGHVSRPLPCIAAWILDLRSQGREPGLVILAEVPPGEDAGAVEREKIRELAASGRLLNAKHVKPPREKHRTPSRNVKFAAWRRSAGVRPEVIAGKAGVSAQTVKNWERGVSSPRLNHIRAMMAIHPGVLEAFGFQVADEERAP